MSNLQNINSQMRAERSVFGKHDLLSIGHNVDLELTLPFLLGPVPWSLSIPDRISTKTDNNEPTLDWPCSAAHNVDVNAVTTEHNSFSCHLHGSDGTSIQPGTKGRACWFCHRYIYTMYKQQFIKSYKHSRITWVFCSTMVYATKCAPSECQQYWPEYGGRDLQ